MNNIILILISLLFLTGISEGKEIPYLQDRNGIKYEVSSLIEIEGLKYAQGDDEPYTGFFVRHYVNNQKKLQNYFKNGVLDGVMTMWYESGQKKSEGQSVNNQQEGLWMGWYENGQKSWEGNHKSGKQHGVYTEWDKEGNVTKTETYKDDELVK